MKKYNLFILPGFLIALLLGGASELCAGGWPPVPKNPSRIFHLRQPRLYRPEFNITRPVHTAPFGTNFRMLTPAVPSVQLSGRVERTALQAQLPQVPPLSTTALFHREGNMEFWRPPVPVPSPQITPRWTTSKRTRESLELELSALDFQPQALEKMTRDELEKTLFSYKAFVAAKEVPFRYIETDEGTLSDQLARLERWAESQPDYVRKNYFAYDEVNEEFEDCANYKEPFHPASKSMRVLAVRDDEYGVEELTQAAGKLHPEVTIELATSVAQAKTLLASNQYDIVLTDYVLEEEHNGFEVAMYVWNKKLNIPVVSYSDAPIAPLTLFKYNIVGEFEPAIFPDEAERALNYLSNIAATGKANQN